MRGGNQTGHLRRAAACALLAIVAVVVAGPALAQPRVARLPAGGDETLRGVADGVGSWLDEALRLAGLEPSPVASELDDPIERARRAAEASAASWVLELRVRAVEEGARVRLVARDAEGALLAASSRSAALDHVGEAAQAALGDLLDRLGHGAAPLAASPPSLADLSALGRAEQALRGGALLEAWHAVEERAGSAGKALRARIEAAAERDDAALAERARLATARGRATEGWLQLQEALRERGDDAELLIAAGDVASARGDLKRALRFYERALEQAPGDARAEAGQARALQALGRAEDAQRAWREAIARKTHDPSVFEGLAALPGVGPDERSELLLRAADLYAARLEIDRALALYERIASGAGDAAGAALRRRGELEARIGRNDAALATLEQAQQRTGAEDAATWAALGRTRERAGDGRGAADAWREALARGHDEGAARAGIGRALALAGDAEAARSELARAVELAPEDALARKQLAVAHRLAGDPEAALSALAEARPAGEAERVETLRLAAEIHSERGELELAREKLEAAVAIEPAEPELREALASLYEAGGEGSRAAQEIALATRLGARVVAPSGVVDPAKALLEEPAPEAASAAGRDRHLELLLATFPDTSPADGRPLARVAFLGVDPQIGTRARVMRWIRPRTIDYGALEARLVEALERRYPSVDASSPPAELDVSVATLRALTTDRDPIALVNGVLDADASFVARLRPLDPEGDGSAGFVLDARLFGGRRNAEVFILANEIEIVSTDALQTWNPRPLLPLALLLLAAGRWFARGWGTLVVKLDYDKKGVRGFFDIVVSRRSVRLKLEKGKPGKKKRRIALSRFKRSMVGSETRMRFLPASELHVAVQGLLLDGSTKEVVGTYLEERPVRLERGQVTTVSFDFRDTDAAVEVRLHRAEDAPDERVRVGVRGRPESFHYVRGDETALRLENGIWVLAAVCGDRVHERRVEIRDFQALRIDLSVAADDALFRGCPDAVEPYVHGNLLRVADLIEANGDTESANLLRADHHRAAGDDAAAAGFLRAAGRLQEAAEIAAEGDDTVQSAELYAEAGDFAKAAEVYREAGDFQRAGEAFESAYDYESAAECFREAGDIVRVIDLLERGGAHLDAGRTAAESGDDERAIRNLQQVDTRDPEYVEACRALADLFAAREEWELALTNLARVVESAGSDQAPLELLERQAELCERAGRPSEALEILEQIRARDFSYEGVAERIDTLREEVARESAPGPDATLAVSAAATQSAPSPDRYEVVREVGRGGMGVVFEARDTKLGRVVALKRLPENLRENPTAVRLFLREARAAAQLSHANIVTLYDADEDAGSYYITMEFLDGLPLDAILRKRGRLSPRDTVRMGLQVAAGLQYAHERRIVHRDIKTSNIFFTRERVVKIMDFGLAKMLEEVRRAATVIAGTPYYMAPEQAAGDAVDHRADLYAFGVTLFELVTGRVPFAKGDVTYHHRHTPPPDPRTLVEGIPDALAELILALMGKSPDDRPATTKEVVSSLKAIHKAIRAAS